MIEEKLDQLKILFSSLNYPLIFASIDGKVVYRNEYFEKLGYKLSLSIENNINMDELIKKKYTYSRYSESIYKWQLYESFDDILVIFVSKESIEYKQIFLAMNQMPISIYAKSKDLEYVFSNNYTSNIAGVKDIVYKSDFDLCWYKQADNLAKNDNTVLKTKKDVQLVETVEINKKLTNFISIKTSVDDYLFGISVKQSDIPKLDFFKNQIAPEVSDINFTAREKDCLKWFIEGKSAYEIGEILSLSSRTVEWHISNIIKKLNLNEPKKLAYYLGFYFSELELV